MTMRLVDTSSRAVRDRWEGTRAEYGAPLSDRECQVLELVAQGLTRAAAGAVLGITEASVKAHVRRALAKTGYPTTTAMVAAFVLEREHAS